MTEISTRAAGLIERMRKQLQSDQYARVACCAYPRLATQFLEAMAVEGRELEGITSADMHRFVDSSRQRHSPKKALSSDQKRYARRAIKLVMRMALGEWPKIQDECPVSDCALAFEYEKWAQEVKGLCAQTASRRRDNLLELLRWLEAQDKSIRTASLPDIDNFLVRRSGRLSRRSMRLLVSDIRCVLVHLQERGIDCPVVVTAISAPRASSLDGCPKSVRPEDIERVLKVCRSDQTPVGLRDTAILTILATYGLRSSEVVALRLDDIDWRSERLRVLHRKTGSRSDYPLLVPVGDALINYLNGGRPQTSVREVFIRRCARYVALAAPGVRNVVRSRFAKANVLLPSGACAHALRHSRAMSLLRQGEPLKVIGDVLGHRSARSTAIYLKLATEDLRRVCLDFPRRVA